MPSRSDIRIRRVFDAPGKGTDGYRVLVDRLWPRGVTHARAGVDEWLKDVAPSTDLRRWYGHDPLLFEEFARRYKAELREPAAADALARLLDRAHAGTVTLVTATRDVDHSGARVLQSVLSRACNSRRRSLRRILPSQAIAT
jgi:uncharacterized protein YeaO (DUF488 family)